MPLPSVTPFKERGRELGRVQAAGGAVWAGCRVGIKQAGLIPLKPCLGRLGAPRDDSPPFPQPLASLCCRPSPHPSAALSPMPACGMTPTPAAHRVRP